MSTAESSMSNPVTSAGAVDAFEDLLCVNYDKDSQVHTTGYFLDFSELLIPILTDVLSTDRQTHTVSP